MVRYAFLVLALLISACAQTPVHVIAKGKAMISICTSDNAPFQEILDMAEAHCARFSRGAELLQQSGHRCLSDTVTVMVVPGWVEHFRCVRP